MRLIKWQSLDPEHIKEYADISTFHTSGHLSALDNLCINTGHLKQCSSKRECQIQWVYATRFLISAAKESTITLFAASDGWPESQNTYVCASRHVPGDRRLHMNDDVSSVPVPQHARFASVNPTPQNPYRGRMGVTTHVSICFYNEQIVSCIMIQ
jgi:hypothetical protein